MEPRTFRRKRGSMSDQMNILPNQQWMSSSSVPGGPWSPPATTVENAKKALKNAKKAARIAKEQAKKRKRAEARARKARRAALATFHEIAADPYSPHRLAAARELKEWGVQGDHS